MKIKYDKELDAMYLILSDAKYHDSEEITKDVIVDYEDKNEIVAIEILNFKNQQSEIELPIAMKILAA